MQVNLRVGWSTGKTKLDRLRSVPTTLCALVVAGLSWGTPHSPSMEVFMFRYLLRLTPVFTLLLILPARAAAQEPNAAAARVAAEDQISSYGMGT
jgi:hypothetical protein